MIILGLSLSLIQCALVYNPNVRTKAQLYGIQEAQLDTIENILCHPLPEVPPQGGVFGDDFYYYIVGNKQQLSCAYNLFFRDTYVPKKRSLLTQDVNQRAMMWGMRPSEIVTIEQKLGEQLIDIPVDFPFQRTPLSAEQFNAIKKDIQPFRAEYENAKKMIQDFNAKKLQSANRKK